MEAKQTIDDDPIRLVTDERLDFNHFRPLRKSYIVAASYRSGSAYLCWKLWQTGLLGAPSEVLNPSGELRALMARFKTSSPAEYVVKLIEHRASRNGIFGMKAHFHHFEAFLKEYPLFLEALSPVTFIYLARRDKVAQAVSMAKAFQTNWWSSRKRNWWSSDGTKVPVPPLRYDRALIEKCMKEVEVQDAGWLQWFESNSIAPHQVIYEDLIADPTVAVRSIVERLGAQNDQPDEVNVPAAEKQGDDTNEEWIERFRHEASAAGKHDKAAAGAASRDVVAADAQPDAPEAETHFCDRFSGLIENRPRGPSSATDLFDATRLRRRYDAIISRNRDVLQNARVLDIMSSYGFWSLAALDAGATHVVGVESSAKLLKAVKQKFSEYGINSKSYRFIRSDIFKALATFKPGQFDVILCKSFERCHFPQIFFQHFSRLRPKHVILDTKIVRGDGPIARFSIAAGRSRPIISCPSHDLIVYLCEPAFRWRLVDWQAMGITDWTGVQDYARDLHRTYVLDRQ